MKKKGLTVVEILVASVIIAVIIYVMTQLYIQGIRFWNLSTAQSDLRSTGRWALAYIERELRLATRNEAGTPPNLLIPAAPNNDDITYYHPSFDAGGDVISDASGNIIWDVNTARILRHVPARDELEHVRGGSADTFAQMVDSITFEDASIDAALNDDEIRVTISLLTVAPLHGAITETLISRI
ncbi:MAG: hypothetical protein MJA29_02880, partial [Candidatus Omnitrophica bacterium]|nr:hypothetical protein [Candidatus Omnitrophota bacterium]